MGSAAPVRTGRLRLNGLVATGATVHPRAGHAFAFPAQKWLQPVQAVLDALSAQDLRWTREDGDLTLQAEVFGQPILLHLSA